MTLLQEIKNNMPFNYSRRVYLGDTDAAGVVYFAKGIEICHEAYEESLAIAGIDLQQILNEGKIALPITHAEINFWRPVFCGDRLQIQLVVNQVTQSEFAIAYQIFALDNLARVLIEARTDHVCINPRTRNRTELPGIIRQWLKQAN